jgi:signal transduction histidine kinase
VTQSLEGVERVAEIVRAMKEFSHPGSSEKTPLDLNRAVQSTLTVARNEWKYVAELALELDEDLPPVPCYPGELNQAVLNIVINAAHAIGDLVGDGTGGRGTLTVRSRRVGEFVELQIRDSGTGIPAEAQARVFDPFFTTKEVGRGTGQGLTLAHSVIVDKHGDFETAEGQGTTFFIRLPLQAAGDATEQEAE